MGGIKDPVLSSRVKIHIGMLHVRNTLTFESKCQGKIFSDLIFQVDFLGELEVKSNPLGALW